MAGDSGAVLLLHAVLCTCVYVSVCRYSTEDCGLPEELSARYMEKAHGLKWRVIRALFYCYTPFVARVHSAGAFAEPDVLLGSRCVVMW